MKEENKKKNEELQSRRQFFKKAGKAVLPILGAVVLGNVPLISKAVTNSYPNCNYACAGGCQGACSGGCKGDCFNYCSSRCGGDCSGRCTNTCHGTCSGGCARSQYA